MPSEDGSFGDSISFRDYPESVEAVKTHSEEAGLGKSQVMRGFTELYREDPHVRELVHGYVQDEYDGLFDYCESELDALDRIAHDVQEGAEYFGPGLDPESVDETLAEFLEALESGEQDEEELRQAVSSFGELDTRLVSTTAWYAGKFVERYWEE